MLPWSGSLQQLWLPSLCPDAVPLSPWAPGYIPPIPRHLSKHSPHNTKPWRVLLLMEWLGELLWPGAGHHGSCALFMGIDCGLDSIGLAGCQRTRRLDQIQARGVTAKVNTAASKKREHINKPQTVKMSRKGLWVPSNPPILPLQPQQHSWPSSLLKGSHNLWAPHKRG